MKTSIQLKTQIRNWIIFFVAALIISGITAFALETELNFLRSLFSGKNEGIGLWMNKVYEALHDMNSKYPFLAYGYDWLAFAHIVIATAFIGPLKDPIRNKWIITWAMIACVMIIPLAFVAGAVRQIPVYWRLIDCSFGIIGIIPLTIVYRLISQLELMYSNNG